MGLFDWIRYKKGTRGQVHCPRLQLVLQRDKVPVPLSLSSKPNPTRFGAEVNATQVPVATPVDEVENILGVPDESISAVLKFEGAAHRRIDPDGKYEPNHYDRKGIYFTASSKSPRSLTADTTVFLSAVSWDKSGAGVPIIV